MPERATKTERASAREVSRGRSSGTSREGPNDGEGETPADLDEVMPQKSEAPSAQMAGAVKPQGPRLRVEASSVGSGDERLGSSDLMEKVCERQNLQAALKRVRENAGSDGIDGMTVEELPNHLRVHWPRLREDLLAGRYQPQPVKRVTIPKPGGGERELGIPTVLDRFIQQDLLGVLQPLFAPSRMRAMALGPDGVRTKRCVARKPTCRKAAASSWTSTWRSSSTGSTTTS